MPPQLILIVGGGQGIGLETAKYILRTSPDARVLVYDLQIDAELEKLPYGGRLWAIYGDVTNLDHSLMNCASNLGGVDTVVYCAAQITPIERIEKLDIDELRKAFDVNVIGAVAVIQRVLPHLRNSRFNNPTNDAFGKIIILSSTCDTETTYSGWMPYCTTKAALTRFIEVLAHEEKTLTVQGVYPKLTRTRMPEDVIAGKYQGVMADHEIVRFKSWNQAGDEFVEPPSWCGEAVAKLALGLLAGGRSGETLYYDEHVPKRLTGT